VDQRLDESHLIGYSTFATQSDVTETEKQFHPINVFLNSFAALIFDVISRVISVLERKMKLLVCQNAVLNTFGFISRNCGCPSCIANTQGSIPKKSETELIAS
jgi:hypothetical protein